MTDLEFDILDELYFVQSFETIQNALEIDILLLKDALRQLIEKGWVRCFKSAATDDVVFAEEIDLDNRYLEYHYLATKEGLLAHNSR